ncbi:MAG: hypothetical protein Q8778_02405 [Sweet potato little leaf phytoplasma]|nr:hypothetical protein [Sweet potato little leaf phytoplasma]
MCGFLNFFGLSFVTFFEIIALKFILDSLSSVFCSKFNNNSKFLPYLITMFIALFYYYFKGVSNYGC